MSSDLYQRRLARVCPPRDQTTLVGASGAKIRIAVTSTTSNTEIDNGLLQRAAPTNGNVRLGSFGRCIVRFRNEGAGVVYWNVSSGGSVTLNTSTTNGNTGTPVTMQAGATEDYELDPAVDKYVNSITASGTTATLSLQIVSFDTEADGIPNP